MLNFSRWTRVQTWKSHSLWFDKVSPQHLQKKKISRKSAILNWISNGLIFLRTPPRKSNDFTLCQLILEMKRMKLIKVFAHIKSYCHSDASSFDVMLIFTMKDKTCESAVHSSILPRLCPFNISRKDLQAN